MTIAPHEPMRDQYPSGIKIAFQDIVAGLGTWRSWLLLSWAQIRSTYRRTILGPWWISIQRAVFIAGISLLFGVLMAQEMKKFVPFVAVGFTVFQFLVSCINSSTNIYTGQSSELINSSMPLSTFAFRSVATNAIQLAHDAIVIVLVLVLFGVPVTLQLLLLPFALTVLLINSVATCFWLGAAATRYRDIPPLIVSATGILFFFTPIFWRIDDITVRQRDVLTGWNPLTYLLEITRDSLLGIPASDNYWAIAILLTLVNVALGFSVFSTTRLRLHYWVQE